MKFNRLIIGVSTLIIIGVLHPVVVKAEYYFGKRCWPLFAITGLLCCYGSVVLEKQVIASILSVLGFSLFWSIKELYEQDKRVKRGCAQSNPKRLNGK